MKLKISYADALAQYPDQVDQAYQKFQKSKSKFKHMKPDEMRWQIEWCEVIENALARDPDDPTDRLSIRLGRVRAWLRCMPGTGGSEVFTAVPNEIRKLYQDMVDKEKIEEDRVKNLTEEQKQQEINDAIKELSKYPGFCVIRRT